MNNLQRQHTHRPLWLHRHALGATLLAAMLAACGGGDDSETTAQASAASELRHTAAASTPTELSTAGPVTATAPRRFSGLAMNLAGFDYWSTDFPTIDQFKRAGGWFTSCDEVKLTNPYEPGACMFNQADKDAGKSAWDTLEQNKLDLDDNGWVRSLPPANDANAKYHHVTAILFAGDNGAHPAGTYTVLYEGKGTLEYSGGTNLTRGDHRDQMTLSNAPGSQLTIRIRSTDPSDYIRNIRVIPPGGVCSKAKTVVVNSASECTGDKGNFISLETLSTTQIWYPNFLADLSGVRALRFMDWGRTNSSALVNWADRPLKTDAFWTGPHGVPTGVMFGLSNTLQADAWINLPTQANDDYVRSLAKQALNTLHPQAQLIVEYTNEPWNGGFWQNYNWQYDRAVELWGEPAKAKPAGSKHEWVLNWHAMRSAQMCELVKTAFGAEANRVKCVLNSQASESWNIVNTSLPCPRAAAQLGHACGQSFDAVAIAPYFGVYISDGEKRQDYISANWFTESDGGLNKLFEEIRAKNSADQSVTPPMAQAGVSDKDQAGGTLAESRLWMQNYRTALSNSPYHLPLYSYEGGQHLVNLPIDCSGKTGSAKTDCEKKRDTFASKWTDLFTRANRDPRMGKAYTTMMDDWRASSGQVFAAFNYASSFSYFGAWGLKESLFKAPSESPKWQAMLPYKDSIACWWSNCQQQ